MDSGSVLDYLDYAAHRRALEAADMNDGDRDMEDSDEVSHGGLDNQRTEYR